MGRVVLGISVSLDGFIEGPNREIDWHRVDDELHQHFNSKLRKMSAFIHGRVTWDLMAQVWPHFDTSVPGPMAEFAGIWLDMPKYVFSRTLQEADWNTTIVREVVPDEIRALTAAGDVSLGGPDLAATFMRHDLVDEYHVYVHPVVIGGGKPLFGNVQIDLRLLGTHTFGNGVVQLRYGRA